MDKTPPILDEISALLAQGYKLVNDFRADPKQGRFDLGYQRWYTRALPIVRRLAPDRYPEFKSYYEIDPKQHGRWSHVYVIQHYMKGVDPFLDEDLDEEDAADTAQESETQRLATNCFLNQLLILDSLKGRVVYAQADRDDQLQLDLQTTQLETARDLLKVSARAAGAVAGAVVEQHLKAMAAKHQLKLSKHRPAIGELSDALKEAGVLDAQASRQVSWLGDIRALCLLPQPIRPTQAQARDLIDGANWLIKNTF